MSSEHKYKNTSMLTCQKLQFSREVALRWPYLLATKAATQILIFAAAFILIGTAPVHSDAEQKISITEIRLWAHPNYTRFVLEMSAEVEANLFLLNDPRRLVIDFPEVEFAIQRMEQSQERPTGVINKYRYGLLKPGTSRVVLDLAMPATIQRHFILPAIDGKPYRFVLDLEKSTDTAFLESVTARTIDTKPDLSQYTAKSKQSPISKDHISTIVIDAGHGGVDPGAIGISGIYEKDIALAAANELAVMINSIGNYRVLLTRSKDIFLPLRDRVAIGRAAQADLFLSLHADSIADRNIRGTHIYSLSETASDKEAEALAAKENKADIIAGINLAAHPPDVGSILLDLSQRETNNLSAKAGNIVIKELKHHGLVLLRKPHRQAGFAVLKAPDVPSLLIELGFLSNKGDVAQLSTAGARALLLRPLSYAIDKYFKTVVSIR